MIIGTAGHVDHGKSALAAALTGRAMDRLAEERRRGITIELGFAPLDLPGGLRAGLVDVPGHEDFVRTMVAGASGIDMVLLVVDAQQGIQQQTLEHLAVVEQLGIPAGIPVVTKADLVEPEWTALVCEDLTARLARSPVRFTPPVVTSAVTGLGIERLRQRIAEVAVRERRERPPEDLFRMPVDRAFAVAGTGTVVTGTVWSGTTAVGDGVRIEPGGLEGRVRSIEQFGTAAARASPGARAALGLASVSRVELRRGQVVVAGDAAWKPVERIDVVLRLLPGVARPLARGTRVRLHLGTAEVMARAYPRVPVAPGSEGLARLVPESPVVARGGDRFVVRSYSPVTTIGGGWIADPDPPHRASWPAGLSATDPRARLGALVRRRPGGRPVNRLAVLLGLPAAAAEAMATSDGLRIVGDRLVPREEFDAAVRHLESRVARFHAETPSARGISLETLRRSLGPARWLGDAAVEHLVAAGRLQVSEGVAMDPSHAPAAGGGEEEVDRVVGAIRQAGLEAPSVAELAALEPRDLAGALRIGVSRGVLEPVERDRYFAVEALARFRVALEEAGQGGGEIAPAALRDRLGLSRKYLIPLLEWADRKGITWRDAAGTRRLRTPRR